MRSMNPPQQPSSCLSEERELVRKPREKFTLKRWIDHLELEADKAERVAKEARLKAESANAERFRRLQEAQAKAEAYVAKRALEVERERKEKAREEEARKAKEEKEKAKRLKEEEYKKAAKIKEEVKRLHEEELRKGKEEARLKEEEAERAKASLKTFKKEDAESTTSLPPPPLSATLKRIGHLAHFRQHSRLLPLIQYSSLDLYKKALYDYLHPNLDSTHLQPSTFVRLAFCIEVVGHFITEVSSKTVILNELLHYTPHQPKGGIEAAL